MNYQPYVFCSFISALSIPQKVKKKKQKTQYLQGSKALSRVWSAPHFYRIAEKFSTIIP
ncbi:hypothetical protein CLOSCI_03302 [[Clostridium] scindens ATCC 35704]|nr:hypothetical protein CLOSCI_03302 [[Clostridium] scindens ATCC 35704]